MKQESAMKNYELLGYEVGSESDFAKRFEELEIERRNEAGCPNVKVVRNYIRTLLNYPCWIHMGYIAPRDSTQELEDGLATTIDYFHGDWWTEEYIRRTEKERPDKLCLTQFNTIEKIIRSNARCMDRSNPDCRYKWYEPLRGGIVFGGLLEKWDDVAHICSALDPSVPPEYSAGTIVDEYFQYYLCVAGQFSGQWDDKFDALLQSAKKCRQKRLRDLIAAWEAAVAGDQAAFNKAFPAAIKSFVKRKDDPSEHMGVALDETVIWLVAKHAGLSFPGMPDKLKAAVMTRQSLGLDSTP